MIQLEAKNISAYLVSDEVIDWQEPKVLAKALDLTSGLTSDVDKARLLFHWVRDEMPHSDDINSEVVTCSASEVLRAGTGICYAKSHLLAALLRSNSIPAGFCYQVLRRDPPLEGMVLHGLNGVFLTGLDKWIRVDSRGNTGDIDTQFGMDREQLAYTMDAGAGEFIHDMIYASPASVVVEVLRKYLKRSEMWPHLPLSLTERR